MSIKQSDISLFLPSVDSYVVKEFDDVRFLYHSYDDLLQKCWWVFHLMNSYLTNVVFFTVKYVESISNHYLRTGSRPSVKTLLRIESK